MKTKEFANNAYYYLLFFCFSSSFIIKSKI